MTRPPHPTAPVDRLGDPTPAGGGVPVRPLRWLFLLAGVLGGISVLVPHDPDTTESGVLAVSATALLTAVVLTRWAHRVTPRALDLLLVLGTVLTGAAILTTGGVPNASASLYAWICLFAFYALPRRRAIAQVALIAASYAAVIALDPPPFPPFAHWTTTTGTLVGTGLLVGALKGRLDRAIASLAGAVRRDPLTGLLNRRGLTEALEGEVARSQRTGAPFALVLADVDRFKLVNDGLGHAAGDGVLRDLADVLRVELRVADVAARAGGEEFAVLLPGTTAEEAVLVAERLRRTTTRHLSRGGTVLTASFGVAAWPDDGVTPEALMHCADRALYAAKRAGRDRVVRFDAEATAELTGGAERGERERALVLLAESLDLRDPSTARHSHTVGRLAAELAADLGLDDDHVERVRLAGILHDVGKLSMPDAVLAKQGPLTAEERRVVERHPELGARLLEGAGLDDLSEWVRCHHERPDGRGYPRGLGGSAIPLEARILAVADAYEAMTADRPYRGARPAAEARAELRRGAGSQFDAALVEIFLAEPGPASGDGAPTRPRAAPV